MVTVGLLSFIVLGLLAMFNQTQRAFKMSMTQTDVLENGRATMDMIARELEQMTPAGTPDYFFGGGWQRATNFFAEFSPVQNPFRVSPPSPLLQELFGNVAVRSNLLQRFFFLSKLNQDWIGIGYQVIPDDANNCIGTLYRYSTNSRTAPVVLSSNFVWNSRVALQGYRSGLPVTNLQRIADGIVHLRARAFATNGYLVTSTNSAIYTNAFALTPRGPYGSVRNTAVYSLAPFDSQQGWCYFMSNAVPAYVELEVGILEPQVLRKYRSIPIPAAGLQYLSNHAAQVHIFRQRIPIRNVDFSAYP
jgi:hypothetical protein